MDEKNKRANEEAQKEENVGDYDQDESIARSFYTASGQGTQSKNMPDNPE